MAKRPLERHSPPRAEIVEYEEESDGMVAHLKGIRPSLYTSIYGALHPNTQYTIVAAGYLEYHEMRCWHFIPDCGLK
ncbi:hypothetical protein BGZ74_005279, partial [Mortierella antarctica]